MCLVSRCLGNTSCVPLVTAVLFLFNNNVHLYSTAQRQCHEHSKVYSHACYTHMLITISGVTVWDLITLTLGLWWILYEGMPTHLKDMCNKAFNCINNLHTIMSTHVSLNLSVYCAFVCHNHMNLLII